MAWAWVETGLVEVEVNATRRPSLLLAGIDRLNTPLFGSPPLAVTSTRIVPGVHADEAPMHVSRQKSPGTTVVLGTISVAQDWKATKRPVGLTPEAPLYASRGEPLKEAETNVVPVVQPEEVPLQVSRMKASPIPVVSPRATFGAGEPKTTNCPSGVTAVPPPLTMVPFISTEIALVLGAHPDGAPMQVSRRNTHARPVDGEQSPLFGRIFVAVLSNAAYLPSALIAAYRL